MLKARTVDKHIENAAFYVNECLLYDDAVRPEEGWNRIDYFLGYWFIKKAMWSSRASIRNNATSLKKFYTFLHEKGRIDRAALEDVHNSVRRGLPEWIATMERYLDPSIEDMDEVWGGD